MSIVRVRQHVNPLSDKYQRVVESPDWSKAYGDLSLPLHLDIGCGRGFFLQKMAQQQPEWNYLGLEIREPLVVEAIARQKALGLTNLHYIFCNANLSLRSLLSSLPAASLRCVSIQFPDPWFKKRHQKRRVVQPELVEAIAAYLAPSGTVFLQSDVEAVEQEMCDRFAEHPAFVRQDPAWLTENPLPVSTERELFTLEKSEAVYRATFIRK